MSGRYDELLILRSLVCVVCGRTRRETMMSDLIYRHIGGCGRCYLHPAVPAFARWRGAA